MVSYDPVWSFMAWCGLPCSYMFLYGFLSAMILYDICVSRLTQVKSDKSGVTLQVKNGMSRVTSQDRNIKNSMLRVIHPVRKDKSKEGHLMWRIYFEMSKITHLEWKSVVKSWELFQEAHTKYGIHFFLDAIVSLEIPYIQVTHYVTPSQSANHPLG